MADEAAVRDELVGLLRYANKTAIAEQLGVSPQAVINWSEGKFPSAKRLQQVRVLYGLGQTKEAAPPDVAGRLEVYLLALTRKRGITPDELARAEADLAAARALAGGAGWQQLIGADDRRGKGSAG